MPFQRHPELVGNSKLTSLLAMKIRLEANGIISFGSDYPIYVIVGSNFTVLTNNKYYFWVYQLPDK